MECRHIREKMSAYIDGIISSEERILIEEHIKSCKECKEFLADMRKTVEYVHNLEDIKPPAWLTQKIMARIRSEVKPKKGIVQKLFYPLYIKLPIQAVAAVLIAVTTLYIFKTIQPEMKFVRVPSEEITPKIPSHEKGRATDIEKGKSIPSQKSKKSFPAKELEFQRDKTEEASKATEPIEQPDLSYRQKAPAPDVSQNKDMSFAGSVAKDSYKTEEISPSQRTKALAGKKEEGISLTVNVKDIDSASNKIAEALVHFEGRIIKTESFEDKKVFIAELNSKNMKELIERLKLIGEVKEEKIDLKVLEGNIWIKIEIMKF